MGVEVYSVSTDTHFTHKAWHEASDTIGKITYPMIGDPPAHHPQLQGHAKAEGLADRGTFLVDPDGVIQFTRSPPRASAATPPSSCARSRPPSTSATTRARSARPSGKRARTPWPRRSTSSARSDRIARSGSRQPRQLSAYLRAATGGRPRRTRQQPRRVGHLGLSSPTSSTRSRACPPGRIGPRARWGCRAPPLVPASMRVGTAVEVEFAGMPLGHEFTSLVLALLQVGGVAPKLRTETRLRCRSRPRGGAPVRDLHVPVVPELPRRRAGAQPDEHPQPRHQPRRHRRRGLPG
jgi:hypothetical protein